MNTSRTPSDATTPDTKLDASADTRHGLSASNRGTNQVGVKEYNKRLVLSLIRARHALSKVEVAQLTGLSAQAASVIMTQLERDGLLIRGEPQRGKVGQPSVPMSLNPEGAYSIGVKIGRRSAEIVLMNMVGDRVELLSTTYAYPSRDILQKFLSDNITGITDNMTRLQYSRIRGIGIAAPTEMWAWEEEFGAPPDIIDEWRNWDLKADVAAEFGLPVHLFNDATSACAAELAFGEGGKYPDFMYFFIATLIGGGIVLDGNLFPGRLGYAGSIAPLPVPSAQPGEPPQPLLKRASVSVLEQMIEKEGGEPEQIWNRLDDWSYLGETLDIWIDQCAENLAYAICSVVSIIDFQGIVIDGALPKDVLHRIVVKTKENVARYDQKGVAPFDILEGHIGKDARVIGAASLPLLADYSRDPDVLFNAATDRVTKVEQSG